VSFTFTLRRYKAVGGAPAAISGSGSLTFRVPLDGDGVAVVSMSAALQLFPKVGRGKLNR
jgi:hypothetical protein